MCDYLDFISKMAADTLEIIAEEAKEIDYRRDDPVDKREVIELSDSELFQRATFIYASVNTLILSAILARIREDLSTRDGEKEENPKVPPFEGME